jgi:hypothetical protein
LVIGIDVEMHLILHFAPIRPFIDEWCISFVIFILLESNLEGETRRPWSALLGRILIPEESADAVVVKHDKFCELTSGGPP